MDKMAMFADFYKNFKFYLNSCSYYRLNRNALLNVQLSNNAHRRNVLDAVDFTIKNEHYFLNFLPQKEIRFLNDKVLLEIGPGQDFGIPAILADLGLKKVILIDPFICQWNPNFHPEFYQILLDKVQNIYPSINFNTLKSFLKNGDHIAPKLTTFELSLENSDHIESNVIDISISNACFEHFVDTDLAIKQLARITKKGGLGFHQIDLRDHRDFQNPLEFLTIPTFLFQKIVKISNGNFGNRLRYTEFNEIFEKYGFHVEFKSDAHAPLDYVLNIQKKAIKKYREMPSEIVGAIGGRFF